MPSEELSRRQLKLNRYVDKNGIRFSVRNDYICEHCDFRYPMSKDFCPKCGLNVDPADKERNSWTKTKDYMDDITPKGTRNKEVLGIPTEEEELEQFGDTFKRADDLDSYLEEFNEYMQDFYRDTWEE